MIILPAKWILFPAFFGTPETWLVGNERIDCRVGIWAQSLALHEHTCVFARGAGYPLLKQVFYVAFYIYIWSFNSVDLNLYDVSQSYGSP